MSLCQNHPCNLHIRILSQLHYMLGGAHVIFQSKECAELKPRVDGFHALHYLLRSESARLLSILPSVLMHYHYITQL